MKLDASSSTTNILVTVMVFLMVFLLPYIDRKVCTGLGINIRHRRTADTREARLLRLREVVFYAIFFVYMAVYVYLVFFSRNALEDYVVHVKPLQDLMNSVHIDTGIVGVTSTILEEGLSDGLSKIQVQKPEDIAQFYMNVMLFVPMGYLLPYVFDWVQKSVNRRPVLICFLVSLLTENLQLIFKVGFYDFDDIIANTLGGFIGQQLYIAIAFIVEKPDWKTDIARHKKWAKLSRKRVLYPVADSLGCSRTVLYVSSPSVVWDFYIGKLGFMNIAEDPGSDSKLPSYLLKIGDFSLEAVCVDSQDLPSFQDICISVENLDRLQKRLEKCGVETGEYTEDRFTLLRKLTVSGPDNVNISFLE